MKTIERNLMRALKKKKQNAKKVLSPTRKKIPGTRLTVDDPVNDVHDDELYEEETELRKEPAMEPEQFERPW